MKVWLESCARERWQEFAPYHYDGETEPLHFGAQCFIAKAEANGQVREIGLAAAIINPIRKGKKGAQVTDPNCWREHKVVVRLPVKDPSPSHIMLWGKIADALARHYVAQDKRFYGHAPQEWAAYRDKPGSGWSPSSMDKAKRKLGRACHEYLGDPSTMTDDELLEYASRVTRAEMDLAGIDSFNTVRKPMVAAEKAGWKRAVAESRAKLVKRGKPTDSGTDPQPDPPAASPVPVELPVAKKRKAKLLYT
jgi:hypothetical protein